MSGAKAERTSCSVILPCRMAAARGAKGIQPTPGHLGAVRAPAQALSNSMHRAGRHCECARDRSLVVIGGAHGDWKVEPGEPRTSFKALRRRSSDNTCS